MTSVKKFFGFDKIADGISDSQLLKGPYEENKIKKKDRFNEKQVMLLFIFHLFLNKDKSYISSYVKNNKENTNNILISLINKNQDFKSYYNSIVSKNSLYSVFPNEYKKFSELSKQGNNYLKKQENTKSINNNIDIIHTYININLFLQTILFNFVYKKLEKKLNTIELKYGDETINKNNLINTKNYYAFYKYKSLFLKYIDNDYYNKFIYNYYIRKNLIDELNKVYTCNINIEGIINFMVEFKSKSYNVDKLFNNIIIKDDEGVYKDIIQKLVVERLLNKELDMQFKF